jgi:hypothetical protein
MSGVIRSKWWKLLVSVVLMVVLFQRIPLTSVTDVFSDPDWTWLLVAVGVFAVSALGGALQWAWILRKAGLTSPISEMLRLYFVGLFFNNFLLGNVGGDAVKIVDLGRHEGKTVAVLGATALDRLTGLLALTMLALGTVALALGTDTAMPPVLPLILALVVWTGALTVLFSRRLAKLLISVLAWLPWDMPAERMNQFLTEFRRYRENRIWLTRVFLMALAVQFLRITTHLFCAWGLGVNLQGEQILQLFVLVPLLGILISLPISLNGLGLREMAAASLFVAVGVTVTEADAIAVEFTAYLVQVAVSLIGGVLFLAGRRAQH